MMGMHGWWVKGQNLSLRKERKEQRFILHLRRDSSIALYIHLTMDYKSDCYRAQEFKSNNESAM